MYTYSNFKLILFWFGAQEVTSLEDQEEVDFSGRVVRFAPRPPSPPTPPVSNLYLERFENLRNISRKALYEGVKMAQSHITLTFFKSITV